jgi:hypothetical protein
MPAAAITMAAAQASKKAFMAALAGNQLRSHYTKWTVADKAFADNETGFVYKIELVSLTIESRLPGLACALSLRFPRENQSALSR